MNGWQLFYDSTVQLIKLYQDSGDMDERIEETERLLAVREEAVTNITAPVSDEERDLAKKCKQLNDHLDGLMQQEKAQIQKELKELRTKKQSTNKYANPYENMNLDGMFYDKKR